MHQEHQERTGGKRALWDRQNVAQQGLLRSSQYRDTLRNHLVMLCENVELDNMWGHLHELGVITRNVEERLRYNASRSQCVRNLQDHLERGPVWRFHAFLRACGLTGQENMITGLGLDASHYKDNLKNHATGGQEGHTEPSADFPQVLDELITELPDYLISDWYKLGVALGVNVTTLDRLYSQGRVHGERWPFRMLQEWKEMMKYARENPVEELAKGLEKIHRGDLVEELRCRILENQEIDEKFLMYLGEKVSTNWYNLGIQLGVSSDKLENIKMEEIPNKNFHPAEELLKAFRDQYDGQNIIEDLKAALGNIRRQDLVRIVNEKMQTEVWSQSHPPHRTPVTLQTQWREPRQEFSGREEPPTATRESTKAFCEQREPRMEFNEDTPSSKGTAYDASSISSFAERPNTEYHSIHPEQRRPQQSRKSEKKQSRQYTPSHDEYQTAVDEGHGVAAAPLSSRSMTKVMFSPTSEFVPSESSFSSGSASYGGTSAIVTSGASYSKENK